MKKTVFATDRLTKEEIASELGNSSGIILEEEDGKISIGYIDYDVSEFGGRDYECYYNLDTENSELLKSTLSNIYTGDLFDMCAKAFTFKLSSTSFEKFCTDNGIVYKKNTY